MIPRITPLIKYRIEKLRTAYPSATDKELYAEYLMKYHRLCACGYEVLTARDTPTMDTALRRARENRTEIRNLKGQKQLINL